MENRDGLQATLYFLLLVKDRTHLARVLRRVRGAAQVTRIARVGI